MFALVTGLGPTAETFWSFDCTGFPTKKKTACGTFRVTHDNVSLTVFPTVREGDLSLGDRMEFTSCLRTGSVFRSPPAGLYDADLGSPTFFLRRVPGV